MAVVATTRTVNRHQLVVKRRTKDDLTFFRGLNGPIDLVLVKALDMLKKDDVYIVICENIRLPKC